jgi:hypothetical protein
VLIHWWDVLARPLVVEYIYVQQLQQQQTPNSTNFKLSERTDDVMEVVLLLSGNSLFQLTRLLFFDYGV